MDAAASITNRPSLRLSYDTLRYHTVVAETDGFMPTRRRGRTAVTRVPNTVGLMFPKEWTLFGEREHLDVLAPQTLSMMSGDGAHRILNGQSEEQKGPRCVPASSMIHVEPVERMDRIENAAEDVPVRPSALFRNTKNDSYWTAKLRKLNSCRRAW